MGSSMERKAGRLRSWAARFGGANLGIPALLDLISNRRRYPVSGPWQAGSLTGAVGSPTVTEAPKGSLSLDGNQALACNGVRELDCEAHKPNRDESRA